MDRRTVVAGLIASFAIACSGPAAELAGGMMQDAGDALAGMGGELADAGMAGLGGAVAGLGGAMAGVGGALSGGAGGNDGGGFGGMSDASAQSEPPLIFEGECDVESGRSTNITAIDQTHTSIGYYAEFPVPGRTPEELIGATVLLCNWEPIGTQEMPCADGTTCTDFGTYPRPRSECTVQSIVEFADGKISTWCGSSNEIKNGDAVVSASGGKYTSVRLALPFAN
jgi:hypothetical protein